MIRLATPISREDVLGLRAGDKVLLSGTLFSARDRAHMFLLEENFEKMKNAVVYHCGPIIKGKKVIAAGPTTSARMSAYTPHLIEKYGVRAIIGKGGMDDNVLEALLGKAAYLSAVGGAAVTCAQCMKVRGVEKEEFGMPEAIWEFEVRDFPVIVTMDAHGNSLHEQVRKDSGKSFRNLL
jgi:tartrate/fumarate subfamily iron-sulfur-dependent hydro-lyase beta chain